MPVWHDAMKEWIEAEELVFLGITQEQHPERCNLFAQWKGFEFPILWDPFNLTGSKAVPNFIAIDEHGIVRSTRPNVKTFVDDFLLVEFEAPAEKVVTKVLDGACAFTGAHHVALPHSAMMAGRDLDESVERFEAWAYDRPEDAVAAFRAGVARRMRYDSKESRPDDFQAAVDHWTHALQLDPNQYIWRRRIQQYGPRMDKPYPFYTWVGEARRAITARGETPVELVAELTPAELAEPRSAKEAGVTDVKSPDPEGKIDRDEMGLISIETAVAFDTSSKAPVATVHSRAASEREAGRTLEPRSGSDDPALDRRPDAAAPGNRAAHRRGHVVGAEAAELRADAARGGGGRAGEGLRALLRLRGSGGHLPVPAPELRGRGGAALASCIADEDEALGTSTRRRVRRRSRHLRTVDAVWRTKPELPRPGGHAGGIVAGGGSPGDVEACAR